MRETQRSLRKEKQTKMFEEGIAFINDGGRDQYQKLRSDSDTLALGTGIKVVAVFHRQPRTDFVDIAAQSRLPVMPQ